MLRHWCN